MIKTKKYMFLGFSILFLCCLCIPMAGVAASGDTSQETVSITEFYNNGKLGDSYERARSGEAVVTISSVEEMKIFFKCLEDFNLTYGISFRQEKDITFSEYTFDYNPDSNWLFVYKDGVCQKHYGVGLPMEVVRQFGLEDVYFKLEIARNFWGEYDGRGYSITGFIAANGGPSVAGGIFGFIRERGIIRNVKIKNCYLDHAWGAICGENRGVIENCSVESVVGNSWAIGGIAYRNCGTIRRCKASNLLWCAAWGFGDFGGIAAVSYSGKISDCAVERLKIKMVESNIHQSDSEVAKQGLSAGGIVGCQRGGQIVNCSSIYEALCTCTGYERVGGIVGCLENGITDNNIKFISSQIGNCISAGKLQGKIAGGIVGKICQTECTSEVLLQNNLNLARVYGSIAGGVVGQLEEGKVTACYSYANSNAPEAVTTTLVVGEKTSGSVVECYTVNQAQVYGEPSANVIDADSTYGNTKMLLTALNNGVTVNSDYAKWKAGVLGYPVLISELDESPQGDYELGSEIETSFPYQPGSTEKPSVTNIPEVTALPTPTVTPEMTVSPTPAVTPEITESPAPAVTPNMTALPSPVPPPGSSASPLPDITASPSNQEEEKNLSQKLTVKKLKVKVNTSMYVGLSWKRSQWADGYQILRSVKSSSGYREIGKTSASEPGYVDKTAKKGRLYYYMVRGYTKKDGSTVYGHGQKKKVKLAWYPVPSLRLSAGRTSSGKSYVQIRISKYFGSYVEVYFKVKGKKYIKAPLKKERIAFYNGKLRFSYKTKSLLYCKVRTYGIKNGKKQYSFFSKEKKIRL